MLGLDLVTMRQALVAEIVPHVLTEVRVLVPWPLTGPDLGLNRGRPIWKSLVWVEAQPAGVPILAVGAVIGLEQVRREHVLSRCLGALGLRLVEGLRRRRVGRRSRRWRR